MNYELPKGHRQRMKQQFLTAEASSFNDHQLLEMLLYAAIPQKDTVPLAYALMNRFGSLKGVLCASPEELRTVERVTESVLFQLRLFRAVQERVEQPLSQSSVLHTAEDAADYLLPHFANRRERRLFLLSLDENRQPSAIDLLNTDEEGERLVDVDRLVECAAARQAVSVVMAHCHVDGNAIPTQADLTTTKLCRDRLRKVGITLDDHLIFAEDKDYVSMKQSRLV